MDNPWNIQSFYELQYFNCPSCVFKNYSKQELVNHAYEFHPQCIEYLNKIEDNSLFDVICPWKNVSIEPKSNCDEESLNDINIKLEDTEYQSQCYKSMLQFQNITCTV